MARVAPLLAAFNAGEWSPILSGRADIDKYSRACREMRNMLPIAQGAAVRRPGTRYVANTKADAAVRLIPFEFSTTQAYIIEAGANYFRFYKDGARIESPPGTPVEISTPYGLADLAQLQWAQSADTLYLAHPSYAPRKLTRSSHTSWTLTTISFTATPAEWTGSNYPAATCFWQQRLWWSGTPAQPQTIWGSKTADFENLTTGTAADSAVKYTLDSDQMNAIRWMRAQKVLILGTAGGEFVLSGGGVGDPVTPTNVLAYPQPSGVGSAPVGSVLIGSSVAFVQRAGRKIHQLNYDVVTQGNSYVAPELSLLAGHLIRAGVKEMAWAQEPWRVLWVVMKDGTLRGCTVMPDEQVTGWHQHVLGGTGVSVESVAVIPASGYSEVWLSVARTIGGGTKRFVERLSEDFAVGGSVTQANAYFVDAGLSYSGAPATTLSGLDHLNGQTVQVLADGATHPNVVVSGGTVTLNQAASVAHVGLGYTSRIETLDINAGADDGAALTRRRRIHSMGVILFETLGGKYGWRDPETNAYQLAEMQFRASNDRMDAPPPLFSGQRVITFPSRWDLAAHVVCQQDQPLPLTVCGIVPRLTANE